MMVMTVSSARSLMAPVRVVAMMAARLTVAVGVVAPKRVTPVQVEGSGVMVAPIPVEGNGTASAPAGLPRVTV